MRKAVKTMIELLSPTWAPPVVEAVRVKRRRIKETKPRQPGGGRKRCLTDEDAAEIAASTESASASACRFGVTAQTIYNYRRRTK
jgi:transposase